MRLALPVGVHRLRVVMLLPVFAGACIGAGVPARSTLQTGVVDWTDGAPNNDGTPNDGGITDGAMTDSGPPIVQSTFVHGIAASLDAMSAADALQMMQTLHVTSTRSWFDIGTSTTQSCSSIDTNHGWGRLPSASDSEFQRLREYHDKGIMTVVVFTTTDKPCGTQVHDWFTHALAAAGGPNNSSIDYWEIINEPNLPNFWPGTLDEVVSEVLIPAYGVLHDPVTGKQKVIAPAIEATATLNYSPTHKSIVQTLIDAHYLDYCDAVAYHPYGNSTAEQITHVTDFYNAVHAVKPTLPIFLTEWNIHGFKAAEIVAAGNSGAALSPSLLTAQQITMLEQTWAASLQSMLTGVAPYVQGVWYYSELVNTQPAGPAGLFNVDANGNVTTPNTQFYNTFKNLTWP